METATKAAKRKRARQEQPEGATGEGAAGVWVPMVCGTDWGEGKGKAQLDNQGQAVVLAHQSAKRASACETLTGTYKLQLAIQP